MVQPASNEEVNNIVDLISHKEKASEIDKIDTDELCDEKNWPEIVKVQAF
ncbi:MAG: hypothetical protein QM504_11185 [Pseudomonadota bacterium]